MVKAVFMVVACYGLCATAFGGQARIEGVEKMPDLPRPYVLRDWKQVARDADALVYGFDRKGEYLPIPWWDRSRVNYPMDVVAMPAYVGSSLQHKENNAYDTITCFGAVLGATKIGLDKSREAEMLNAYFQQANGIELYLNNVQTTTGHSFWYELLPSLLFYQVYDHYPDTPDMSRNFIRTAERWYETTVALGGKAADFDWTAYDFDAGKPIDNGKWKEPDAAAGVAWLEYMAFTQTGNTNFLNAAEWAMRFLDKRRENPYYECLMPFGAYVAVRINAERGTAHQTDKFINWVFDGDNPRQWGVDANGLSGSVISGHEYVFAMNTFIATGTMLPIVRYDDAYARDLGKWLLNVAVNARLFYSNAWKPEQQSCAQWAAANDPGSCLAYEGLRHQGLMRERIAADHSTAAGSVASGSAAQTVGEDGQCQVLAADEKGRLEHVWKMQFTPAEKNILVVRGWCGGDGEFDFFISAKPDRSWRELFTVDSPVLDNKWKMLDAREGPLYLKIQGRGGTFHADDIYIRTYLDQRPYAMGDAVRMGWGKTDFALYASVFAGLLGAIVEPTDVEGILQLDCRATESFAAPSYPTHLYYNPHKRVKTVTVPLPAEPVDLYDAVANRVVARGQAGSFRVRIKPDSAVLLVRYPASGTVVHVGQKTKVNGVVVDYNNGRGK